MNDKESLLSITSDYEQRLVSAETSIGVLADSMVKVVKSVEDLSTKTEHINTTVARMEANQGKLPTNALLGWLSFAITLIAFIGLLFINPIKENVLRNTTDLIAAPATIQENLRYETTLRLTPFEQRLSLLENNYGSLNESVIEINSNRFTNSDGNHLSSQINDLKAEVAYLKGIKMVNE